MVNVTLPDQYPFKQRHNKLRNLNWSETGHVIDADIVPLTPGIYSLGTADNPFASGNFNFIAASGLGEIDSIQFNTNPIVGAFSEGKAYYDTNWKTLSVNLGRDCNLQVGQEEWRRVYNNKNRTVKTGTLVYTDGVGAAVGGQRVATITMAKANSSTTSSVLGVLTQDIPSLNYGFVTVRGHVNNMNTNALGGSYITTQGVDFTSLVGGVASNSYTIEFIDTGSGGLSYSDTGGTIVVNLGGSSSTSQNLVDLMYVTSPSTVVDAALSTQGVSVALAVQAVQSFSGGVETTEGDVLYLSPNQRGKITTVKPSSPNVEFRIGRLITKSATEGRINVRLIQSYALNDLNDVVSTAPVTNDLVKFNGTNWVNSTASIDELSDVEITSPVVDNALKYNGSKWINGDISVVSAGVGVTFFLDSTKIIPAGVGPQTKSLETLSKAPSALVEVKEDKSVNSNTGLIDQYMYNTALGITSIPGGKWTFDNYVSVDDASGTSEVLTSICKVVPGTGTITIAASGEATCWATVAGASPFVASDYNIDLVKTGTIITASGVYPINGFKSNTEIDVETLSTYTGETNAPYSIAYHLFDITTGDIPELVASLHETSSIQPAYAINTTDKLMAKYFARTNNAGPIVVSLYHGGTDNYTNFITPLAVLHNDLPGIQGGASSEKYHLSELEYNHQLPPTVSGQTGKVLTNDGDHTDWALSSTLLGTSGYSGYSGISGYSGYSGVSGYSGYSSTSGYSGYSGTSGYSGYSGISGYSGYSGISGYSGYSGTSGYSGFNYTLVATLASPAATAGDTNNINLTGLVWTYEVNSIYIFRFLGSAQTANTNTGYGFALNVSSAVTDMAINFVTPITAGASASITGGSAVTDDTAYSWSNANASANTPMALSGFGILRTAGNTGTAQLRFRSETNTVATANAGLTLIVEKVA